MSTLLFDNGIHKCIAFTDLVEGEGIQANQFLIVHNGEGMLLDPGGNLTYKNLLAEMASYFLPAHLNYVFASHEDPDIVASANGWLLITDAKILIANEWTRFLPHFCSKGMTAGRVIGIPARGMPINLAGQALSLIPAHYMHSVGNFQVYDPLSKILFSGDLGANLVSGPDASKVIEGAEAFAAHRAVSSMNGFHRRYMGGQKVCRLWTHMIRSMDIDWIVPQHGASFKGKETITAFLDWFEALESGPDLLTQDDFQFPVPENEGGAA
ncbi:MULTISPECIES: MBL fold metallo-hydrolase [Acidithiobacillus]|uniref:MBL fold metallo-hydrolase n=1 Tax=Acidithiobacillus TaxID=119977 RepID=UPI00094B0339|nr:MULTISPECIES: MBL fold metallo-hydrolase [Acidithiobacillus]MBE7563661.1 FprA family A-type flavoprotein [Acidithiobacillus sp. HP-6]MBE7569460.1 FprA family A-type flavoprotein [Acidithiobacillus sp. HP-2]